MSAATETALARAHRRMMVRRLPRFALCWLGLTAAWATVLLSEARLGPAGALGFCAVQAGLVGATLAAARSRASGRAVLVTVVGGCVGLGWAATAIFAAVRGNADFLAFVLLTLYLASSLFFEWGWRPALVLLLATVGGWLPALFRAPVNVPAAELVGAEIAIVSVGEERDQTIHNDKFF